MTNEERSKNILDDIMKRRGISVELIERALDEAEKRVRMENPPYSVGFKDGQRDMREKCAKHIDHEITDGGNVFAKSIRALPLEGEAK